jgi:hydroxypyruvate reductase
MPRTAEELRRDALAIFAAGLDAVRSPRLVAEALRVEGRTLYVGGEAIALDQVERIAVVGAGKAGSGMAAAVLDALGPQVAEEKQLFGWINVPADCARPLERVRLHAARPPRVNEPTAEGVRGSLEILRIVESRGPRDLCLALLSGGGSALLPLPVEGVTLDDKLAVTRHLSAAGATIEELNTVRKQLSRIKGGGLAAACRAGRLVALIISDVLGDPLEVIASGPTVPDSSTPEEALDVLRRFGAEAAGVSRRVFDYLEAKARAKPSRRGAEATAPGAGAVTNLVIGNNATAVAAAGREAARRGYAEACFCAQGPEGTAEDLGRHLAEMALHMRSRPGPDCLVSGGEPVVRLVEASRRGLGGRNQQLVLAALAHLADRGGMEGVAILSAGTDGEDGPTDAAGAVADAPLVAAAGAAALHAEDFLQRNDAYHFFQPLGGLVQTGPTDTNVCDLRVVVVDPGTP